MVLAGEIDMSSAGQVRAVVQTVLRSELPVEVDTGAVTFIDSVGISELARLVGRAPHVTFLRPPPVVRFLLEVTAIGNDADIDDGPDPVTPANSTTDSAVE